MTEATAHDKKVLGQIAAKLARGERLGLADGVALYEIEDVFGLGQLAEEMVPAGHGRKVYYSINRHINYTNVCEIGCRFCGFSRRVGQSSGYVMSVDEVADQARQAQEEGATEVHIVGGIHPELTWEYYAGMVRRVSERCPGLHIKAFTAVEILDMAHKAGQSVEEVLTRLQQLGLGSLPGGGAEILNKDYFARACPNKPGPEQWLAVHATAHRLGLMTNATMLYGYIEAPADRVEHLLKIRQLQDKAIEGNKGRFQCFVPLPYLAPAEPGGQRQADHDRDGGDILTKLRTIAISRLMLDNIAHIKAFWPILGEKGAQVALCFGADDLDGTVQRYRIVEQSRDNSEGCLSVERIRWLISEAGREPVQRDGFYGTV